MRHGTSSNRRQRNRGNGGGRRGGGNQRMQVFDSNGPDVRIRGTAHQVHEKYMALAKDCTASGDRVLAESYMQYAEHYQRIIGSWDEGVQNQKDDRSQKDKKEQSAGDDLSLPGSILGNVSEAKKETRTEEIAAG